MTGSPRPRTRSPATLLVVLVSALVLVAGCGGDPEPEAGTSEADEAESLFPDVVDVVARRDGDGTWTFAVTLSSPYDSAERYADAWRVRGPDGEVYGIRELAHDHGGEQPFTRNQSGIEIPPEVDRVIVEGRDQVSGWGGATVEVSLEG
jgi:hypothetical protein